MGSTVSNIGNSNLPAGLPVSSSGISTHNRGSGTVIKSKIGKVVDSAMSNISRNNFPARLPTSTSSVSTHHDSGIEIRSDIGDVEGSNISNIGNDNSNTGTGTNRLCLLLVSFLTLFLLANYSFPSGQ